MVCRGASRQLTLLLLACAAVSIGTRGLCFMPGTGEGGVRGAHDCCKNGLRAAQPPCCMAGQADEAPAVYVSHQTVPAATAEARTFSHATPVVPQEAEVLSPPRRIHSPPAGLVLRI